MSESLKKRYERFITNEFVWKTALLNAVLCGCMIYFYYDSAGIVVPLFYAVFFFLYLIFVFIFGEKIIPILYVIYSAGALQDITFINATIFFIFMLLSWELPKWKNPLTVIYILEAVIVCVRHERTPVHLLFHFGYCFTLYAGATIIKHNIEKRAVVNVSEHFKKLDLTPEEEEILKQKAEGKLMKEITGVSKNTRTAYIKAAMQRNGCKTQEELLALYTIQKRIY